MPAPRRGDVRASCTAPRPTPREPTQREDPGQDGKPVDPEVAAERIVELLRDTRRASDDVSGASEPLGVIVTADIELLGLRGRPVLLSWEMYQQEGARRLHGDWLNTNLAYRLVAEAESDATTQDISIPLPRSAGPFFVRVLAKVDGTRLDSEGQRTVRLIEETKMLVVGNRGEMMQRINQGKAEAVFHTGFTGGLRSGQGAPANPNRTVTIKPFEEQGVSHYCAEDWHVILLGLSIGEGTVGLTVTSVGEAKKLFKPTVMTFVLDDKPFETTRLPVKPLLSDEPGKWFVLVEGRVVGPDELAAGSHTLSVTVENDPDPEFAETYTLTRQFFIDAAGTGVCT